MALKRIQMAGFGGQGILLMGKLIALAAMYDDKEVTWMPAYGPEMRGGTANCTVCIDDKTITSPYVTKYETLVAMNEPSLRKFEGMLVPGGDLFINSSLIKVKPERTDINIHYVDSTGIAEEKFGTSKVASMIMLGAILKITHFSTMETMEKVLKETMTGSKAKTIPMNMEALNAWSKE